MVESEKEITVGFVGQGYIGKSYADVMEAAGHTVVRYALEEPYVQNKEKIQKCDIVFVAVPTPTTPDGFDGSIVKEGIALTGESAIVVIKSTVVPGTTDSFQEAFPTRTILFSPEFLVAKNAASDAANPERNIIGVTTDTAEAREAAETVMKLLPKAPFELICSAREAELVKYIGNAFLYTKVVFMNLTHDLVEKNSGDWDVVRSAVSADPRIGISHTDVVHDSGRGAGGPCFIKDFATLIEEYEKVLPQDALGLQALRAYEQKNVQLLKDSDKDPELLAGVYGDDV